MSTTHIISPRHLMKKRERSTNHRALFSKRMMSMQFLAGRCSVLILFLNATFLFTKFYSTYLSQSVDRYLHRQISIFLQPLHTDDRQVLFDVPIAFFEKKMEFETNTSTVYTEFSPLITSDNIIQTTSNDSILLIPKPNPFDSIPPMSIPFVEQYEMIPNETSFSYFYERMIQNRHQCIYHIRQKHYDVLNRFFHTEDNNPLNVLLVDPAYHENVGDHMLTLGENYYYNNIQTNDAIIEQCSYTQAGSFVEPCRNFTTTTGLFPNTSIVTKNNKTVAMWHAGGNWGNLWRTTHLKRIESFRMILEAGYRRIISMPQSLYYITLKDKTMNKTAEVDKRRDTVRMERSIAVGLGLVPVNKINTTTPQEVYRILRNNANIVKDRLVFTWREFVSFQQASQLYPYATNLLVPDIAFQLGPYNGTNLIEKSSTIVRTDIVFFLRLDYESIFYKQRNRDRLQQIIQSKTRRNITFTLVDWKDRLEMFNTTDYFFTDTSIQLLAMGKVVIADRLHASILAYLSGIPLIYLDNVSRKINQTLQVAFKQWKGCENRQHGMYDSAKNLSSAISRAIEFLSKYKL